MGIAAVNLTALKNTHSLAFPAGGTSSTGFNSLAFPESTPSSGFNSLAFPSAPPNTDTGRAFLSFLVD